MFFAVDLLKIGFEELIKNPFVANIFNNVMRICQCHAQNVASANKAIIVQHSKNDKFKIHSLSVCVLAYIQYKVDYLLYYSTRRNLTFYNFCKIFGTKSGFI